MPRPVAANSRSQLSRILSKTGFASATELLMTCSTSAVAVCCSSASWVSLKRRAFWIAITAWSANVFSSAMSFSENGRGVRRPTKIVPMPRPSHSSGAMITERVATVAELRFTYGGTSAASCTSG